LHPHGPVEQIIGLLKHCQLIEKREEKDPSLPKNHLKSSNHIINSKSSPRKSRKQTVSGMSFLEPQEIPSVPKNLGPPGPNWQSQHDPNLETGHFGRHWRHSSAVLTASPSADGVPKGAIRRSQQVAMGWDFSNILWMGQRNPAPA